MDACCGTGQEPAPPVCCGDGAVDDYPYDRGDWIVGVVDSAAGPIPRISTELSAPDARGRLRVRLGVRRQHYRVRPGLYAVGSPTPDAPVLVTANYKLSLDALRSELDGIDAWVLVLDTKGINVWCAAGKGTFGTRELVTRVQDTRLARVVAHRTLTLPQLGAPGVAGHLVPKLCGFSVRYGPVRARDLPRYLAEDGRATPEMRRVTFTLRERLALAPVELSVLWRPKVIAAIAVLVALSAVGSGGLDLAGWPSRAAVLLGAPAAGLLAGALVTPALLPWLPGRSFSFKGALVGAVAAAVLVFGLGAAQSVSGIVSIFAVAMTIASFTAMNFTGATTYTSLSGVVWEMRRALPLQVAGVVLALAAFVASFVIG